MIHPSANQEEGRYSLALKQLIDNPRIQQMRRLGAVLATPDQILHHAHTHRRGIAGHVLGDGERALQHGLLVRADLAEQAVEQAVLGRHDRARRDQVRGAAVADQPRQEEGRARLHDQAAPREHEADLGVLRRQPDVAGQRHGDADADGGAVQGRDGWRSAVVDGEGDAAAAGVEVVS
jgi:hypothetical protein